MQISQWCFIENFALTPATRKYRATSHKYKLSIIGSSVVTSSSLKNDESFLSLTSYESIINGSLNSNFLIGQIQQRQLQQLRASTMAEKVEESLCLEMKL
ncbi:hypothetical protein IGI04_020297 [Brassica rapa subsp. trilocularis]|uniref:DUF223 domain-containing protein n=1 Tax=Brassica rapa subsp. trilocularis TaxID=1813537 RepID=A0ABQ7MIB3_BRACM|nr:hypothetical protein IGI04_020297 [Brassica rapa subsp. trilocularis]